MKIKVNGREYNYPEDRPISYGDVFAMAKPNHKGEPIKGASITYHWKGDGDAERNGMIDGEKVIAPADGMVFNCYFTGNA